MVNETEAPRRLTPRTEVSSSRMRSKTSSGSSSASMAPAGDPSNPPGSPKALRTTSEPGSGPGGVELAQRHIWMHRIHSSASSTSSASPMPTAPDTNQPTSCGHLADRAERQGAWDHPGVDLGAPRTGSLRLSVRVDGEDRPVLDDGGTVVARVRPSRRHPNRVVFDVVDLDGTVVANGGRHPETVRALRLRTAEGEPLLDPRGRWWRPSRLGISLPDGTALGVQASERFRRFRVVDRAGREVATFVEVARSWSDEGCPCEVTLREPVLSTVQAIGLAEFLQGRAQATRSLSG
jgi:hypothetical protein